MVISSTPLRVSLAGGGTDLPVFADEWGGVVVSGAIDKYVYVAVSDGFDSGVRASYSDTEVVEHASLLRHSLIREALVRHGRVNSVEVTTISNVPAGTGLGSSASVTVGLVNALQPSLRWVPAKLAAQAYDIERAVISPDAGRQDQLPAAYGGLRSYRLLSRRHAGDVQAGGDALTASLADDLSQVLILVYTGRQRSAQSVLGGIAAHPDVEVLLEIRDTAIDLSMKIATPSWRPALIEALTRGWDLKRRLPGVTSEKIDAIYSTAIRAGAKAGKLLGAGSGGFMLLYVEPEARQRVIDAVNLKTLPFKFVSDGSEIIHRS